MKQNLIRSILRLASLMMLPVMSSALTNDELIALHKVGLDESIILIKVDTEPADYDLSVDGLIALKQAGVPEAIIQRAVARQAGVALGGGSVAAPKPAVPVAIPSIAPPKITPVVGQRYFMRLTLHYEKGKHSATNYARGELLPINTEVELVSMRGKDFRLRRLDSGDTITVENVPNYTQVSIEELAARYLAAQRTPLERLPEHFARAIPLGTMRLGMNRELVLMARGYPPAHETPSLEGDTWKFWSSRFAVHTIVFENGRLAQGRGIN